jgi:hypothetical protein
MKTLFHLFAVNRDGFRVTPLETGHDRRIVERTLAERNAPGGAGGRVRHAGARWIAVEVERMTGRRLGAVTPDSGRPLAAG